MLRVHDKKPFFILVCVRQTKKSDTLICPPLKSAFVRLFVRSLKGVCNVLHRSKSLYHSSKEIKNGVEGFNFFFTDKRRGRRMMRKEQIILCEFFLLLFEKAFFHCPLLSNDSTFFCSSFFTLLFDAEKNIKSKSERDSSN